ncbi:MAG: glycosyltransferase family 4 protein [Lachnospiraceae bacterium]|nr:glycosyltransferase family 4 protein [Lachnospiraceae bacterium]
MVHDKKTHILVISQCFYPEPFRINDICEEWVQRGYGVTVITGIPNYPEGKFYDGYGLKQRRKENWNEINIIRLPLIPRGHNSLGLVLNYLSFPVSEYIWKCTTNIKPDYIFMFETSPMTQCMLGVWLKKKLRKKGINIPLYAYIQDLWPENVEIVTGIHSPLIIKPIDKMVRYIYRNCDAIFATSPSFVGEIVKRGADKEKVHYWPQYAEEFYYPRERTPNDALPVDDTALKIIFTGNIGYAQGLDILPKTAAILKERGCYVHFYIVGDGRYREKFVEEIHQNNVEDMFFLTGRKPAAEIPDLLACADVAFFSFMDTELFAKTIPAKLQSYMACGMPILASARGESVRIIDEAGCGLHSDIGDSEGLTSKIIEMKNMESQKLEDMSKNARAYYLKHFEKKMLMDKIDEYLLHC